MKRVDRRQLKVERRLRRVESWRKIRGRKRYEEEKDNAEAQRTLRFAEKNRNEVGLDVRASWGAACCAPTQIKDKPNRGGF
jgi:hypothetical protein